MKAMRPGGTTALMDAAAAGHERVIAVLVAAATSKDEKTGAKTVDKAVLDATDAHGMTALMHAARAGHDTAMLPLLRGKASLNVQDRGEPDKGIPRKTALAHAATEECYHRLLNGGADPKSRKEPPPEARGRAKLGSVGGGAAAGDQQQAGGGARSGANSARGARRSSVAPCAASNAPEAAASPQAQTGGTDFLKVRPRAAENLGSGYGREKKPAQAGFTPGASPEGAATMRRSSSFRRGATAVASAPVKPVDKEAVKQDKAARLLQTIFKLRLISRLRAEAKFFGMVKKFKAPSNHW